MKVKDVQHGKTTRKSFARIEEILEMPNLIEVQKKSYEWFLAEGLREVFADAASITDYTGNLELSFLDYTMDEEPKYSIEECKARDATYATPLKVRMRLRNKETGEIKEQEIFMGDFPKMTDSATFIINGAERAIVSQLVRSPGVYYGKELDKTDKVLLSTTVIPYRGAWLEYETDANDIFYVRIDKNRKIPITSFIRAIGVKTDAEIKELFGEEAEELRKRGGDRGEYGATTGRPRRVGWFDCVATRYGCEMQGATEVAMTNLDVLGYLDEIPVCVAYEFNGERVDNFPVTPKLEQCKPIYVKLPGWKCDTRGIKSFDELPENARHYIEFLEKEVGCPFKLISNGPRRDEIIYR